MRPDLHGPAKALIVMGVLLASIGAVLWLGPKLPGIGRLPGDIFIERGNVRVYVPITSCLLASAAIRRATDTVGSTGDWSESH